MVQITKDIWTFPVDLPDNPLKWLNSYVIKPEHGRCLLIDTGFKRAECTETLLAGMQELGLEPENTDVFITHFHADHAGNVGLLQDMGYRVITGELDHAYYHSDTRGKAGLRMLSEGMSKETLDRNYSESPIYLYSSRRYYADTVKDGDVLRYGEHELECICTPGHTPGHMCLYDRREKIMFLGDHVLFDITPNITAWYGCEDSLGDYLDSLRKIREYDVVLPLQAHRIRGDMTLTERIDQLLAHHEARLNEAERVVRENPGINAHDAAGKMTWRIRSRSWAEFPVAQKYFAMGETLSHMDYLVNRGRIKRLVDSEGHVTYTV